MKIGDKVRLRDPDSFTTKFRKMIGNRIGDVVGLSWPYSEPIVKFPAAGKKKEYTTNILNSRDLELVTDPPHGKEGV